jgi:hypothetical protein
MWTSSVRQTALTVGICAASLLGAGTLLAHIGPRHFLPEQKLRQAAAGGDDCFLFLGDSRMAAGFDASALRGALRQHAVDRCVVDLAIGASDVSGAFLATRAYLATGRRPHAAVLGSVADFPLGLAVPLQVNEMVGNNAIHLTWTKSRDVFAEVPNFPTGGIATIDQAFRFLALRATPFGRYQSLFVRRLQDLDARLAGSTATDRNRFGALGDMALLESRLRSGAVERLSDALMSSEERRASPWFHALRELLARAGVPLVVVELPMPSAFRRSVTETAPARSYRAWLAANLNASGGAFVDISNPAWLRDGLFEDELHLGTEGAANLSADIGRALATLHSRSR